MFLRSWTSRTPLSFMSNPMFVAGIIKYGERTWVLRSARKQHFGDALLPVPDPGPDYAEFVKKYDPEIYKMRRTKKETIGGTTLILGRKYINEAYLLFKMQFRHLYADLILSLDDQHKSEGIIRYVSSEEAFKVVEAELSFFYDVLYTKAVVVYSPLGILLRTVSFLSIISTLVAFSFFIEMLEFSNVDVNITYTLLFGAIFLEIYAIVMLILSDWSIVWLCSSKRKYTLLTNWIHRDITSFPSSTSGKRLSRSMAQNSLIDSCLRDKTKFDHEVNSFFDKNKFLERYWYMTWEKVDDMEEPIYSFLLEMTNDVRRDLKKLLKHRGDYVITKKGDSISRKLGWSVVDVEFDHSILLWHIATDLFSYYDDDEDSYPKSARCKISKCMSEYMLYLLVLRPSMLPKGIGKFRFRDTCSEAKRFFQQRK